MDTQEKLRQAFKNTLESFVQDEIKAFNSGIWDRRDGYIHPSEVDYGYIFYNWVADELANWQEDIDWDDIKNQIVEKVAPVEEDWLDKNFYCL